MDDIRPKGTVEVRCSYPGCGIAWWVDPLDPILPDGPFDCGDDHETTAMVERKLSLLRLRHGIRWGSISPSGAPPTLKNGCCGLPAQAVAIVYDRLGGTSGFLTWDSLADLADVDELARKVVWDQKAWPDIARAMDENDTEKTPPGYVRWVGYETNGEVRKYTFVKCARPGCPHNVMVDTRDPSFRPVEHAVGAWGNGIMLAPSWYSRISLKCEDGLSTFGTQPCELVLSNIVEKFEAMSGARWTIWEEIDGIGNVLFFDPVKKRYGIFTYLDHSPFQTVTRLAEGIQWGSLMDLEKILPTDSEVLREVRCHTNLPS